jgi:peptide/nickel transport system ATP-binding protein
MIALALARHPKLLLADEPTTALDATVQIQILLLLRELQREFGMAAIFVTHDIGVAVEVADKLAVMYGGEFVETGSLRKVIRDARHPYTRGLLAANLHGVRKGERLEAIPGAPPALEVAPTACSFAPPCRWAQASCNSERPPEVELDRGRMVRCILARTDEVVSTAARSTPVDAEASVNDITLPDRTARYASPAGPFTMSST